MADTKKPPASTKGIESSAIQSAAPVKPASPLKRHTSQVLTAVDSHADRQDGMERHVAVGLIEQIAPRRRAHASWP